MSNSEITRRLLGILAPYRSRLFICLLAMIGAACTELAFPWAFQKLLDRGFSGARDLPVWMVPAVILTIFVLRGIFTFTNAYMSNWVISRSLNDMRRSMFDRLLQLPVSRFHEESTGALLNTMIAEVQQTVGMVASVFIVVVRDSLTIVVMMGNLLYLNWRLTMVTLIVLPVIAVIVRVSSRRLRRLNRENQRVTEEMTQVVEEAARGHQVIRVFSGERYERARFEARSQALRGFSQRITVAAATTVPVTQLAAALSVSLVIVLALRFGNNGEMSAGEFISFITSMLMILTPLRHLADVNGPLQRGMAASESVFRLMDAQIEPDPGTVELPRARGRLRFDHVSFRYSERDRPALTDVTLDIAPGETLALVGVSGGGKSTMVSMVARFYAPTSGTIYLDEVPYPELKLASLRAQLAMVSQNVVLFDDTLGANIAYGVEKVDQQRLAQAVRAAHLTEVVANLPQGLDTVIGENGMRLSGGQRQRVAIARAIYKDAPILILDEATSALDTESERAVQAALDELMQGRTTLVIAHRLSTIERADRIAVMEGGRIVEIGKHQELLAKGGMYANLYNLQFAKEAA